MTDTSSYIPFYTGSMVLCHGLSSALISNDIRVIVKDEYESARLAGFGSIPDLQTIYIREKDLAEAEDIKLFYLNNLGG
jgi:hypothetical protein